MALNSDIRRAIAIRQYMMLRKFMAPSQIKTPANDNDGASDLPMPA